MCDDASIHKAQYYYTTATLLSIYRSNIKFIQLGVAFQFLALTMSRTTGPALIQILKC